MEIAQYTSHLGKPTHVCLPTSQSGEQSLGYHGRTWLNSLIQSGLRSVDASGEKRDFEVERAGAHTFPWCVGGQMEHGRNEKPGDVGEGEKRIKRQRP